MWTCDLISKILWFGLLSSPGPSPVIKECRQCIYFETCTDKLSTDETADWYVKSKCKVFYYPVVAKIVPARQPEVG